MNDHNNERFTTLHEALREEFDYQLDKLRRITQHGPSLGRFVEILLINLFKKYLPHSIDFSSGFVMCNSLLNPCSPQFDIICYDHLNFPVIFDINEFKVIPASAVKGIIEVKSAFTSNNIKDIFNITTHQTLKEIPLKSKFYAFAEKSKVSCDTAFEMLKEFYDRKPSINHFFSVIYSLSWKAIIISRQNFIEDRIEFEIFRLHLPQKNSLSIFFGILMSDIYGQNATNSIINNLMPSLFRPIGEPLKYSIYVKYPPQIYQEME